jgi:uncharacterized protein YjdB
MYTTIEGKFFAIDPATKEASLMHSGSISGLEMDLLGNFYMFEGSHLIRYTVNDPGVSVTHVELTDKTLQLSAGDSYSLTAVVYPEMATNKKVTWTSDNSNVATVDAAGHVVAVNPGTVAITVTTDDGNLQAVCNITVSE